MCILCIIEGFLELIRMMDELEMGFPTSEEEERTMFEAIQSRPEDSEYITLTHKDGTTERFKIPN